MQNQLVLLGTILLLAGFALVFAGFLLQPGTHQTESAGIIMLGPIPIAFGSKRLLLPLMLLALALMIAWFFLWRH